jgi:tetratricopeptide (TPR) repeat protein
MPRSVETAPPSLLTRAFAAILLWEPLRRRLGGTAAKGVLAALAEQTGRVGLAIEPPDPLPPPQPAVAALHADALRQLEDDGKPAIAARTIGRALKQAPSDVACLDLAARIDSRLGRHAFAERYGRMAVALAPRVPSLRFDLGNCLREQKRLPEAVACYEAALALLPDFLQARLNLALCLAQLGRGVEAARAYADIVARPAVALPERACQAIALLALNRVADAEHCLDLNLAEAPTHIQSMIDMAALYRRTRRFAEAEVLLTRALAVDPGNWAVHYGLAAVFLDINRHHQAIASARQSLSRKPGELSALSTLIRALGAAGAFDEAAVLLEKAGAVDRKATQHLWALLLEETHRFAEAGAAFDQLVADRPEDRWAHFGRAVHKLRQGRFVEGWRDYEWRWKWDRFPTARRSFRQPEWSLLAKPGARVLVHNEQGLGDTIQLLRYIPMIEAAGFAVVLDVQPPLVRFAKAYGWTDVFATGEAPPKFDYQIPFFSLPNAFGTTVETVPPMPAFPSSATTSPIRSDGRLAVGIAWAGGAQHAQDHARSIGLARLQPLLAVDGIRFVSLQKGADATLSGVLDSEWIERATDLFDTAGVVAGLDLVITVDTVIAHLSGALGKPTWVMLPYTADWRWLVGRDDSVWYETIRLFRQPRHGDWDSVVQCLVAALANWRAEAVTSPA